MTLKHTGVYILQFAFQRIIFEVHAGKICCNKFVWLAILSFLCTKLTGPRRYRFVPYSRHFLKYWTFLHIFKRIYKKIVSYMDFKIFKFVVAHNKIKRNVSYHFAKIQKTFWKHWSPLFYKTFRLIIADHNPFCPNFRFISHIFVHIHCIA